MKAGTSKSLRFAVWRSRFAVFALIALVVILGHYLRFSSYGFYEDDYWAITPYLTQPVGLLSNIFKNAFLYWPQGRPLNHSLPMALSIIGYKLGGLLGIYVLACAWLTVNALLVYAIARRLLSGPSALLAAFVYVLFPADTTKILITHAAHVQGSMTFLLTGIYLWQIGGFWRWVSYAVAALSLLAYESAFLPFLAVPLLWAGTRNATARTWLIHIALCTLIVVVVAAVRLYTGDVRASGVVASPGESAYMLFTSLFLGPLTSFRMLLQGAWIGLQQYSYAGLFSVLILLTFVSLCRRYLVAVPTFIDRPRANVWPSWLEKSRSASGHLPWWWILFAALIMLSGSYALTLTNYPPTQLSGRLTSTHVAAGWGTALAIAAIFEGAQRIAGKHTTSLTALVCVWVGTLLLYHDYVQREYVRAWEIQRDFWHQVIKLAPEAGPGWSIIFDGSVADQSRMIASNSWADFHVCRQLLNPDSSANTPACAHLGVTGHLIGFSLQDDGWEWNPSFWGEARQSLDQRRLILLRSDRGALTRVVSIDTPAGRLESAVPSTPNPAAVRWPNTTLGRIYFP